jgi:hypothetical protein
MKAKKIIFLLAGAASTLFSPIVLGNELTLKSSSGENIVIYLQPEDCFLNVIDAINSQLDLDSDFLDEKVPAFISNERRFQIDVCVSNTGMNAKVSKAKATGRDYNKELTQQQRDDISYIVKTLAEQNYFEVLRQKSSLKKAGDRIDIVHPLRFLECIFTNEKLKTSMSDLSSKTLAWGNFLKGLKKSLSQEAKSGNLTQPQIKDFASKVNIDPNSIMPSIQGQRWDELVNILIGGGGRYDM